MVVYNADRIDPAGSAILGDVREVTGVCLPHPAESILLKGLTIPEVRVPCRLQVVLLDEALHCADTDRSRDKAVLDQLGMDLCGIEPREFLFQTVDLLNGGVRQHPGGALVGTFHRHQGVDPATLIGGDPAFQGLEADLPDRTVREFDGFLSDPLVESSP